MPIEIEIKNVNRDFVPNPAALSKLLKVVEKIYKSRVEFFFVPATRYCVEPTGTIIPDSHVIITVKECTPNSHRLKSKDYTFQAKEINEKIQHLLKLSNVQSLDEPNITTISAGGRTYTFLDSELSKDSEWR